MAGAGPRAGTGTARRLLGEASEAGGTGEAGGWDAGTGGTGLPCGTGLRRPETWLGLGSVVSGQGEGAGQS